MLQRKNHMAGMSRSACCRAPVLTDSKFNHGGLAEENARFWRSWKPRPAVVIGVVVVVLLAMYLRRSLGTGLAPSSTIQRPLAVLY